MISRRVSAFGHLFWGTGENNSHVIVILSEMGKEKRGRKRHLSHMQCFGSAVITHADIWAGV